MQEVGPQVQGGKRVFGAPRTILAWTADVERVQRNDTDRSKKPSTDLCGQHSNLRQAVPVELTDLQFFADHRVLSKSEASDSICHLGT